MEYDARIRNNELSLRTLTPGVSYTIKNMSATAVRLSCNVSAMWFCEAWHHARSLTVADLKVFVDVRGLNSGRLGHVPTDPVEKLAPSLNVQMERIARLPTVFQYFAKFGAKQAILTAPMRGACSVGRRRVTWPRP